MRMFLVGMCDIFLLLYLTAVAQVDARHMSSLTVTDYIAVKQSEADLKARADKKDKELLEREIAANRAELKLAALEKQLEKIANEKSKIELASQSVRKDLEEAESRETAAKLAKKEAQSEADAARAETQKLEQTARQVAEQQEKSARETAEREAQLRRELQSNAAKLEQVKSTAEDERLRADEERARAEKARLLAEELAKEAQAQKAAAVAADLKTKDALEKQDQAQRAAEVARRGRERAIEEAEVASASAKDAQDLAQFALGRAQKAVKETDQTREQIRSITQPVDRAYSANVERKMVSLEIEVVTSGMLGDNTEQYTFKSVPVRYDDERVVFVPSGQVGIEDAGDADDVRRLTIRTSSGTATKLYLFPNAAVTGIVLPGRGDSVPAFAGRSLNEYMPTLLAVRNGSPMRFADRMRAVSSSHYPFQRDRLHYGVGNNLKFDAEGFRGTGDFAEQLIAGDQVVDLDGKFIGLATSENEVLPIPSMKRWKAVELYGKSAKDIALGMLTGIP